MRRNRSAGVVVLASLLLGLPVAARGEILTWAMEGTIQSVDDPLGLIGFAQVEGHVRYTFTFDSSAPNTSSNQISGRYSALTSTVEVGMRSLSTQLPNPIVDVARGGYQHLGDAFGVTSWLNVDGMPGSIYFRLYDTAGTALPDPSLPSEPYPLSDFGWTQFSCSVSGPTSPDYPSGTTLNFTGSVNSFYAIPEPCSLILFGVAGAVFMIRRERIKGRESFTTDRTIRP